MDSFCNACCVANVLVGIVVLILVGIIYNRTSKSGFSGGVTVASDMSWGPPTAGAGMRFEGGQFSGTGQTGANVSPMIVHRNGFLGNPEAPVFYNVGDISSVYDTIVGAASDDSEGPVTDTRHFAAESAKRSGFGIGLDTDRALAGY